MKKRIISMLVLAVMVAAMLPLDVSAAALSEECEHEWGDWFEVEEATCMEPGLEERQCLLCGEYEQEIIPTDMADHEWSDWVTIKEPTLLENGEETHQCELCGVTETVKIFALEPYIELNYNAIKIKSNMTRHLRVSMEEGDRVKSCKSSNIKVAAVKALKQNGDYYCNVLVTGKKKGTAVITVTLQSGVTATCEVTVLTGRIPMYTGSGWHDVLIDEMVKKAGLKQSMSDQQIAKKAYAYIVKTFQYDGREKYKVKRRHKVPSESAKEKVLKKAEALDKKNKAIFNDEHVSSWMFEREWYYHIGNCVTFAEVYAGMCERMGVEAGIVDGEGHKGQHSWNWVKIKSNGKVKKYYVDATRGINDYANKKKVNYKHFKMTRKTVKKTYKKVSSEY